MQNTPNPPKSTLAPDPKTFILEARYTPITNGFDYWPNPSTTSAIHALQQDLVGLGVAISIGLTFGNITLTKGKNSFVFDPRACETTLALYPQGHDDYVFALGVIALLYVLEKGQRLTLEIEASQGQALEMAEASLSLAQYAVAQSKL